MGRRLKWTDVAGQGGLLEYRQIVQRRDTEDVHSHDFPEIFWIEEGSGSHWVNGELVSLSKGSIVLMRPSDAHGYRNLDKGGMRFANFAYAPEIRLHILKRYGGEAKALFNPPGRLPFSAKLSPPELEGLSGRAKDLAFGKPSLAALDCFLLGVMRLLSRESALDAAKGVPEWLIGACAKASDPEVFSKGVPALVALCGRSPEHVSREFMRHLGVTPTAYVNRMRLDYAAARLRTGSASVKEIAMECGWNDLSFFHRVFLREFGASPKRYRLASCKSIV